MMVPRVPRARPTKQISPGTSSSGRRTVTDAKIKAPDNRVSEARI
jgi:hypothetical protein